MVGSVGELPTRSAVFDAGGHGALPGLGALLLAVIAQREQPVDYLFVVLVSLPLALRRRFPRAGRAVIFAVGVVQPLVGVRIGIYDAAVLFALYTAVGSTNRRFGLVALGAALLAVAGRRRDRVVGLDRPTARPPRPAGCGSRPRSGAGLWCWSPGRWGSGSDRPGWERSPWPSGPSSSSGSVSSRPNSSPRRNERGSPARCMT